MDTITRQPPRIPHVGTDALVPRPALLDRLEVAGHTTLAAISAPPGYGKITLLAQWADHDPRSSWPRNYLALTDVGAAKVTLREVDSLLWRRPKLGDLGRQADELRRQLGAMRGGYDRAQLHLSQHTVKSQAMSTGSSGRRRAARRSGTPATSACSSSSPATTRKEAGDGGT